MLQSITAASAIAFHTGLADAGCWVSLPKSQAIVHQKLFTSTYWVVLSERANYQ